MKDTDIEKAADEYAKTAFKALDVPYIKSQAFIAGAKWAQREAFNEAIEAAALSIQPHDPRCQNWQCGNCARAGAILALKRKEES